MALRFFFIWCFPYFAGDSALYSELAANWLNHGVYGMWLDGRLIPVDIRMPGYPAFLAAVWATLGRTSDAVLVVQALLDVASCFLIAGLAARLVSGNQRPRVTAAALWLAALCPFTANYTATPLAETPTLFLTVAALVLLLDRRWFLAGLAAGLGTLLRPETPLVLAAGALAAFPLLSWKDRFRSNALMAAGLILCLAPWTARNWISLGKFQPLAPPAANLPGETNPQGFYAWTSTWLWQMEDIYKFSFKVEEEPIPVESVPEAAFDSPQERARVALLLKQYNSLVLLTPEIDEGFAQLARERARRHPVRTYLLIPLARVWTLWFTPRIELLPFSGESWEMDPVDSSVTWLFRLLNFGYAGLALWGAWRWRRQAAVYLPVAYIVLRTALMSQVAAPEPRYMVLAFPAVLALGAAVLARQTPDPE